MPAQITNKSKKPKNNTVWKSVLILLGIGIGAIAVVITLIAVNGGSTDIRSNAMDFRTQYMKRCNLTIRPPVTCDAGYRCVTDRTYNGKTPPARGMWGKCIPGGTVSQPEIITCYNRVIAYAGTYNWPDSCKGAVVSEFMCAQVLVPLTASEIKEYHAWIAAGRPSPAGCGITSSGNRSVSGK